MSPVLLFSGGSLTVRSSCWAPGSEIYFRIPGPPPASRDFQVLHDYPTPPNLGNQ
jgi:hypothetical protein